MFTDQVIETAKAQVGAFVNQLNTELRNNYLQAAMNWADTKAHGEAGPPPVAPLGVDVIVSVDGDTVNFKLIAAAKPVSTIKPESFLPTYATDTNAVGGPVGGAIAGEAGKFYIASGASVYAGQVYIQNSNVYVVQQPTPFQKFWVKVN